MPDETPQPDPSPSTPSQADPQRGFLEYQTPTPQAGKAGYVARIFIGLGTGIASGFLGLWLAYLSDFAPLFFIVVASALAFLVYLTARKQQAGYLMGFVIAPFLVCSGIFVFLLIVCGMH